MSSATGSRKHASRRVYLGLLPERGAVRRRWQPLERVAAPPRFLTPPPPLAHDPLPRGSLPTRGASAAVDDPRLEGALEHTQLVLELLWVEAFRLRVRGHLAQRETEAETRERLDRETLEARRAEIGDERARLVEQPDAFGVIGLERIEELRQTAAADRCPTFGANCAETEEVRRALCVPEGAVLYGVRPRAEDAAQSLTPRGCAVVCEIPRLPRSSSVGHRGAHYSRHRVDASSTIQQLRKGGGRTWRLNSS